LNHAKLFKLAPLALGAAIVGGAMSLPATPASAAPAANIASAIPAQNEMLHQVQYRRHGYYRGYRGGHYRRDRGGAVAAGVIGGLALGAILGAAASAPPPAPGYYGRPYAVDSDWLAYCSSKYRSFDPRSGTYLGYDGLRHPCQ